MPLSHTSVLRSRYNPRVGSISFSRIVPWVCRRYNNLYSVLEFSGVANRPQLQQKPE
jgi:hypothetical protein